MAMSFKFGCCVRPCSCDSEYQDKKYGRKLRLFNKMKKENCWRCTVCGKEV